MAAVEGRPFQGRVKSQQPRTVLPFRKRKLFISPSPQGTRAYRYNPIWLKAES
jgi:hypothetical protein